LCAIFPITRTINLPNCERLHLFCKKAGFFAPHLFKIAYLKKEICESLFGDKDRREPNPYKEWSEFMLKHTINNFKCCLFFYNFCWNLRFWDYQFFKTQHLNATDSPHAIQIKLKAIHRFVKTYIFYWYSPQFTTGIVSKTKMYRFYEDHRIKSWR
jgi:hypothetical protein